MDIRTGCDSFSGFVFSKIECLRELGKIVIYLYFLKSSTVGSESLVKWNSVPFRILPIRDGGRNPPIVLFASINRARGTLHHRHRRCSWTTRDFFVTKLWRLQGIVLHVVHFD